MSIGSAGWAITSPDVLTDNDTAHVGYSPLTLLQQNAVSARGRLVLRFDPLAIAPVHDGAPPRLVGEIPVDRTCESTLQRFRRLKTKRRRQMRRVDGVPAVVAGSVLHVCDERVARRGARGRARRESLAQRCIRGKARIEQGTHLLHDVDVHMLGATTNVERLTRDISKQNFCDGATVIFHEQPVAHLLAVTVDRQRMPCSAFTISSGINFSGK